MSAAPKLLNDDQTASIATAIMMSHYGIRRDLLRLVAALEVSEPIANERVELLRGAWERYSATLHGHHQAEDTGVFPGLIAHEPSTRTVIERLSEDHRQIDPLLERGSAAFEQLPLPDAALAVVRELRQFLDAHLETEERELFPFLRAQKELPAPPNEEALDMYAQGFAWSMYGIAPEVIEKVLLMLPEPLRERLPAARSAFEASFEQTWGKAAIGAATTPIPDGWHEPSANDARG